ncbi:HAD family hydrolase [Helicovermis profundi]|uniref:phosphoserine phosphatase n=1 Tax=Helicovermis profundi TaxID=3065157 RepID=A0AAU9E5N9_9FIRM|nr:HAD-IB family hydrolase [Clostridia bacterium S502]
MTIAAFYDIDGTLYRDSLMIEHFKKLLKYEVIDPALWHNHVKHTHRDWLERIGEYDDYMIELANIYIEALKGLNKEKIDFIADQVIKLKGDIVYTYTRDRIYWHKLNGHKVIFVSGSPEHLVEKLAEKYGIEDYVGTKYLVDSESKFTGEVVPMWDSEHKNKAIKNFVDKYSIDLNKSYAYGDTNGDFSMLSQVGNPYAINPTKELFNNIKYDPDLSKKISIIVERKDIVYKLDTNVNTL